MQQQSSVEIRLSSAFHVEMSEVLMPSDTNNLGHVLGGRILEWMDAYGVIAGRCFAERQVVTASMDHMDFFIPIDAGDVVTAEAYVFDADRTSVDIKVDVITERPNEGDCHETLISFFIFVALDDDKEPIPIPDFIYNSQEERELRDTAFQKHREHRAALTEEFK